MTAMHLRTESRGRPSLTRGDIRHGRAAPRERTIKVRAHVLTWRWSTTIVAATGLVRRARRWRAPMNLPFTAAEFLAVFERYNLAIWPLQIVAYALGLVAVALALGRWRHADRSISAILAVFWLWTGAAY